MTDLVFHHDSDDLPRGRPGRIPVLLYGGGPPEKGAASIGGQVYQHLRSLPFMIPDRAFDLLTVAMAVTAADSFVDKRLSDDGWSRKLKLSIPLIEPSAWGVAKPLLESALNFLSGDVWEFDLLSDGLSPPMPKVRGLIINPVDHDCVSLFSGGLDSAIGALDLLAKGRSPVLVSHSYTGDKERQHTARKRLPRKLAEFSASAHPQSWLGQPNDVQMRTRSFNFLAYGTAVAAMMAREHIAPAPISLLVPENGLIALNPPLTHRRIGALSTRTTHPFYLDLIQKLLDSLSLPVRIVNPYALKTKGEMLAGCKDRKSLERLAKDTVSCGKWKRQHIQCGKCIPCLIRRASFHAAGMPDKTPYSSSGVDLGKVMRNEAGRDDLLAMLLAARRMASSNLGKWVNSSGPLPLDRTRRDGLIDVARRGMDEVAVFLAHHGIT